MKSYHLTPEQALEIASDLELAELDIAVWENGYVEFETKEALQSFVNAALDQVLGEPVGAIWENTDYGKGEVTGHFVGPIKTHQPSFIKLTELYAPKGQP